MIHIHLVGLPSRPAIRFPFIPSFPAALVLTMVSHRSAVRQRQGRSWRPLAYSWRSAGLDVVGGGATGFAEANADRGFDQVGGFSAGQVVGLDPLDVSTVGAVVDADEPAADHGNSGNTSGAANVPGVIGSLPSTNARRAAQSGKRGSSAAGSV